MGAAEERLVFGCADDLEGDLDEGSGVVAG